MKQNDIKAQERARKRNDPGAGHLDPDPGLCIIYVCVYIYIYIYI